MPAVPPRLEALLRRELGAIDVALVGPAGDDEAPASALAIHTDLGRGFTLRVTLGPTPVDRASVAHRLAVIVESFRELLTEAIERSPRPTSADRLHDELRGLALAAGATDAVVIDAQSQIVWGAADAPDSRPQVASPLAPVIPLDKRARESAAPPLPLPATERAVERLRQLPIMASVARGAAALSHHDRDGDPPVVARSFATIYVLVLVFSAPFDELKAERAIQGRLGLLERLVISLPPLEPTPVAGAKAVRRRR
jgi:hypothetical protein